MTAPIKTSTQMMEMGSSGGEADGWLQDPVTHYVFSTNSAGLDVASGGRVNYFTSATLGLLNVFNQRVVSSGDSTRLPGAAPLFGEHIREAFRILRKSKTE